jgi:hypothetical protein
MPLALALLSCCLAGPLELGPAGFTFSPGPEFPGAKGSLAPSAAGADLHFDFTGGGNYVAAYHTFDLTPTAAITLRMRKPAEAQLTFRVVDESGQNLQKTVSYDGDDWQRMEILNSGWSGWWGGANDGQVHGRLKSFGILVENRGLTDKIGLISFEQVQVQPGAPTGGGRVVRTTYVVSDFGPDSGWGGGLAAGSWHYRPGGRLNQSLALFGKPQSLTFKATGGVAGQKVILRLGSHFQTFERAIGELTGGPVALTTALPPDGWRYYGGENDGKVQPPLRVNEIAIDGPGGPGVLTDLSLICTTEVARSHGVELLTTPGQSAEGGTAFACRLVNLLSEPLKGTLKLAAEDWQGHAVGADQVQRVTLPAGRGQAVSLTVPGAAAPAYLGAQWTFAAGEVQAASLATWTAAQPPAPPAAGSGLEPGSPWGMGVYLYRCPAGPEMDRAAALAQAAGVRWTREEFQWQRLEPAKGRYDWTFYDRLTDCATAHGLSVYGLLAYWSGWADKYTEAGIADYARWAGAVAAHYKGRIDHWEIWNEPNIFFWSGPKELYPKLLAQAYAAIKAANPEAQVLGCATAGVDFGFIKRVVDAGAPFDILSVHPYRGRLGEAEFIGDLKRASTLAGGKPVWISEMGWPTQIGGTPEDEQARLLARSYLTAAGSGACPNMAWYDYRNDANDPYYNEANFGVLRRDFRPKPAYRALATIGNTLRGVKAASQVDLGRGLWCFRFQAADGPVFALWSEADRLLQLDLDPGARAVELLGEARPLAAPALVLLRAGTPILVVGSSKLALAGEPLKLSAPRGVPPGQPVMVTLTRPGGVSGTVRLSLPPDAAAGRYRLPVPVTVGDQALVWPVTVEVLPEVIVG